ncbi:alpha/beta hydrolase [Streptomyces sp. NPDC049915]|uniref:alpha/beta hydrolase n=1 Tax=Streptomyces sp. NPDC049915 TaxID=3155510 RepID=UPI00341E52AE
MPAPDLAAHLAPPDPATPPLPPAALADEDVRMLRAVPYCVRDGSRPLELDLWLPVGPPARPLPAVVFVHGGAWRTGLRDDMGPRLRAWRTTPFARLVRAGFAVACPDYRLSGEAVHPAQQEDLAAALARLRTRGGELGLAAERPVLWGESAGGHLAALYALTAGRTVAGCVVRYGPTDLTGAAAHTLEALLLGHAAADDPDRAREASPSAHVGGEAPAFLLLHGADDTIVPVTQSRDLAAALRAAGADVTFRAVPGADHLWTGAPDALVEEVFAQSVEFAGRIVRRR